MCPTLLAHWIMVLEGREATISAQSSTEKHGKRWNNVATKSVAEYAPWPGYMSSMQESRAEVGQICETQSSRFFNRYPRHECSYSKGTHVNKRAKKLTWQLVNISTGTFFTTNITKWDTAKGVGTVVSAATTAQSFACKMLYSRSSKGLIHWRTSSHHTEFQSRMEWIALCSVA